MGFAICKPNIRSSGWMDQRSDQDSEEITARRSVCPILFDCRSFLIPLSIKQSVPYWLIRTLAYARIINIMEVTINISIFDRLRTPREHKVASVVRIIVLTFVNFIELVICFGLLYITMLPSLSGSTDSWSAFYFSVITQLTIGYGDIHPVGWTRLVAVCQGLCGLVLTVLVIGRVIGVLPRIAEVMVDQDK
jgi:potassium channel LctB